LRHILLVLLCLNIEIFAEGVAHDEQYYTKDIKNTQLIYTKSNIPFAKQAAGKEGTLHKKYSDIFEWNLDEKLYVGLMSQKNQIANGYSTQYPLNRQINFIGGTSMIDYFASTSWLDTLLYHETTHNYQTNVKGSSVSRGLHTIFGNGFLFAMPYFIIPNITCSSFMLEGNAVLNESWHGNGGRLWSGRFKAETMMQAKAGYITPERTYNETLYFPYHENMYVTGSFFQLYLAQKYGLSRTNHYFKEHSIYWYWPFFVNDAMYYTFSKDYEDLIKEFSQSMQNKAKYFHEAQGKKIVTSKFFYPLNRDNEFIYFLINSDGKNSQELVLFDKEIHDLNKTASDLLGGKVIKTNHKFYTQASHSLSAMSVMQGLYDNRAILKDGSAGKMVQGYLHDGRCVYFDVASSFDQAQLYVGDTLYAQVNSSVLIDKNDNIYYFVQKANHRILYKNRRALVGFEGYYGIVSDIDSEGNIYFIANSKLGSTLYKYTNGSIIRVLDADNIIDAKLVDDKRVLVAAIGSDNYYYSIETMKQKIEVPYFENMNLHVSLTPSSDDMNLSIDTTHKYHAPLDMHYSGTSFDMTSTKDKSYYNIAMTFADPLVQNSATLFVNNDINSVTMLGLSYLNTQTIIDYTLMSYAVVDKNSSIKTKRDYGLSAQADLKYLRLGFYSGDMTLSYYLDYMQGREPIAANLNLSYARHFGVSKYYKKYASLDIYGGKERVDRFFGAKLKAQYDLFDESYLSLFTQYSQSDSQSYFNQSGVKLTSQKQSLDNDPSVVVMPSFNANAYLRYIVKGNVEFKQVFDYAHYYFTFPLSLRREAVALGYSSYKLDLYNNLHLDVHESYISLISELLLLNKVPFDFIGSYYHNDLYKNIPNESQDRFLFSIGSNF